ncbi:MAG TPA: phosphoglucosamine mutase [Candidatus Cloacimonas sp.]|jgi:phosphomannomutase|nr:phosphoglucosamine mutase [Candidatus Cloacimonas sp.]HRR50702.1 phosphoglucosamine mutase [Candidatus Cloacimonas sp.]
MNKLMTSVSGVRGVFADTLNPIIAIKYAAHFALIQKRHYPEEKPHIIVGRDSRTTGQAMLHSIISAIISVGCDVTDLGIVSTPTLLLKVQESDAIGGIAITASHNPPQWNAMKFVDADGMFLSPEKAEYFLNSVENEIIWAAWDSMGKITKDNSAIQEHIDRILAIPYLNLEQIRSRKFKVVLDSVNGAGGLISPYLLEGLGCTVYEINSEATGIFAHTAEPLNENLHQLEEAVTFYKADIGFATDPDVDRLSLVSEQGKCIGEELSVALAELFVLPKKRGDIVVNLSSSMISDDIAELFGVQVHRTKVGEINVGKKMQAIKSPIGGEGNGGIICPDVHYTRDAIAGMALILGLLAEQDKPLSAIVDSLPKYYFAKDKLILDASRMENVMQNIPSFFEGYQLDTQDGIKAIGNKHFIHIRKSGTEPIIRIYVESESIEKSRALCEEAKKIIERASI